MSDEKLIIVELVDEHECIYHVKARLVRYMRDGVSIPEYIRKNVLAVVKITYNDDCSMKVKIGNAWERSWPEIHDQIIGIIKDRVDWMYENVEVEMHNIDETVERKTVLKFTELADSEYEELADAQKDS